MPEIFDEYCWETHKKVITYQKHRIEGLKNFAYWNLSRAIPPTPLHHHSDIVEIHCLIKGKRFCQVNGGQYTVTGNELFVTFPFEPHNNGNFHQDPCSFYGFQVDVKNPRTLLGLNEEYSLALYNLLLNLKSRHLRFLPSDGTLLKLAFDSIARGTPGDIRMGVQYLCCFLFKLPAFEAVTQQDGHHRDPNIQAVLDYIEENYREELFLKELAARAGYSLSRFKSKFKEEVGMTPANFITFRKLEYAKELLEHTDYPVTQIALDAGFSSSNYFCTVLKKLSNHTPSEYRQYVRENPAGSPEPPREGTAPRR